MYRMPSYLLRRSGYFPAGPGKHVNTCEYAVTTVFGRTRSHSDTGCYPATAARDPVIPIVAGVRVVDSSLQCCHVTFTGVRGLAYLETLDDTRVSTQWASILQCMCAELVHKRPSYCNRRICELRSLLPVLFCRGLTCHVCRLVRPGAVWGVC